MTATQINRWKRVQSKVGAIPDGDPRGDNTLKHIEVAVGLEPYEAPAPKPLPPAEPLSLAALALIIQFEVGGGEAYYNKYLSRPTYPGLQSGPTIGIGYDLGYETAGIAPFSNYLPAAQLIRLMKGLGLKGAKAKTFCDGVKDIKIPWAAALDVFERVTVPKEILLTKRAWPGSDLLHPDAFGALVSVIFNRGASIGDTARRREMAVIQKILKSHDPRRAQTHELIAQQVEAMGRLWPDNPKSDGDLNDRRRAEAALIRQAAKNIA